MSDVAAAQDNAAKLINLLLATEAAGVFSSETGDWSGPVLPDSPTAIAAVVTTAPTNTTPYGYSTSAQALDIITKLNLVIGVLVTAGFAVT